MCPAKSSRIGGKHSDVPLHSPRLAGRMLRIRCVREQPGSPLVERRRRRGSGEQAEEEEEKKAEDGRAARSGARGESAREGEREARRGAQGTRAQGRGAEG